MRTRVSERVQKDYTEYIGIYNIPNIQKTDGFPTNEICKASTANNQ